MPEDHQAESNLSKEDALRQLQGLIAQLETVVGKLETTTSDDALRSLPLADLTRSVDQVLTAVRADPPEPDPSPADAIAPDSELTEPEPAPPTASEPEAEPEDWGGFDTDTDENPPTEPLPEPKGLDAVLPTFRQLQRTWDRLLKSVRSLLPDNLNETLSDWMLTGIISSVVVVVLIGSVVLTGDDSAPTAIAPTAPSSPTAPTLSPRPTPTAPPTPRPTPKPAPTPTPKPQPAPATPPLRLTPEQRLIAAIQDQVAEITNQYAEGLIRSIQADFLSSRLVVTVGEAWYGLEARRQDQVANEVLVRSRRLDFSQVELLDENGDQVARNPIVGSEMVILQRSPLQEAIALP
ncbi:hypothetical protein [Spirulina major]|uniref:hypothetical protein n=1 Tax=Spirulina major TaxID=270636 RepID=UPI0009336701|nr:hypothetical protein [Spirulina major]